MAALASRDLVTKEKATGALAKLASGGDTARQMIAAAGGIEPLVSLLDGIEANGSELAQQDAAAALAELALLPANKRMIDLAGGIAPLVALLCAPRTPPSHMLATACFCALSEASHLQLTAQMMASLQLTARWWSDLSLVSETCLLLTLAAAQSTSLTARAKRKRPT